MNAQGQTLKKQLQRKNLMTLALLTGACLTTALTTVPAYATTNTWNVTGGGDWDTATANWTTDGGATTTTFTDDGTVDVRFDKTAGGAIAISAGMSPLSTTVAAASGTYTFTGGPIDSGSLAKEGNGTLDIRVTPANFSSITVQGGILFLYAAETGFAPNGASFNMPDTTVASGAILKGYRAHAVGNLTMNGGRYFEDNGWGGSWTGPVYLESDSFFGNGSWWCYSLTLNGTISGPGGFTSESYNNGSTLTLASSNSYAGPTLVKSGTLQCNNVDSLGTNALSVSASGAKVNLNYSGEHPVASLTLGGVPQPGGTHGSSASGADYPNDTYFAGAGTVRVPASSAKEILTFSFGVLGDATIVDTNITMQVPFGTDVTALAPTYTVSSAASGMPISGTTRDFTNPQIYTVTAQDLTTKEFVVTVTETILPDIFTWINPAASGTWSVAANWTNEEDLVTAPLAGGRVSYTLNFTRTGTYSATHDLNSGFLLNQLNFGGAVTLENGAETGNSLAFTNNAATLPAINQNSGSQVKVYNDLQLGAAVAFGGSGNGWVDLYGLISGSGSLTKNGSGTLAINKDLADNSFSGGTILNSGTLRINPLATLGTGPITLNGGTLYCFRFHPNNQIIVNGGSLTSENGFGNSINGPVTLNATLPCNVIYTLDCNSAISGSGGITKTGNGPLLLNATNTFTGATTIQAGTLQVNSSGQLASLQVVVTNTGLLKLSNSSSLAEHVTLSIAGTGGAKIDIPNGVTQTITALYLGSDGKPEWLGTWGPSGSGATNIDDVHFTATSGMLRVLTGLQRGMVITIR